MSCVSVDLDSVLVYVQVSSRYVSQLKDSHRNHPFIRDYMQRVCENLQ